MDYEQLRKRAAPSTSPHGHLADSVREVKIGKHLSPTHSRVPSPTDTVETLHGRFSRSPNADEEKKDKKFTYTVRVGEAVGFNPHEQSMTNLREISEPAVVLEKQQSPATLVEPSQFVEMAARTDEAIFKRFTQRDSRRKGALQRDFVPFSCMAYQGLDELRLTYRQSQAKKQSDTESSVPIKDEPIVKSLQNRTQI